MSPRPDRTTYLAGKRPVKSADRVIDLVEFLAPRDDVTSFETIRAQFGWPRSALHGLLTTLEQRGWLRYHRGQGYSLCASLVPGVRALLEARS